MSFRPAIDNILASNSETDIPTENYIIFVFNFAKNTGFYESHTRLSFTVFNIKLIPKKNIYNDNHRTNRILFPNRHLRGIKFSVPLIYEQFKLVFNKPENLKVTAQYIIDAFNKRSKILNQ